MTFPASIYCRATRCCCVALTVFALGCGASSSPVASNAEAPSSANSTTTPSTTEAPLLTAPATAEQKFVGPLADAYSRIDPEKDGWPTETLGAEAGERLKLLGKALQAAAAPTESNTSNFLEADFGATTLAEIGDEVYRDTEVTVTRSGEASAKLGENRGLARFTEWHEEFQQHFAKPAATHLKFKVVGVEPQADGFATTVLFHADGHADQAIEISGTWQVAWSKPDGAQTRIRQITTSKSEIVTKQTPSPLFADCTASVLEGQDAYANQFLYSTDHWRRRIPRNYGLDVVANHGLTLGDVNGDGLDDVYICQQGGLPNRLFIQQQDGTLVDRSEVSGTDWLDYSPSALLVDLDNDGDRDFVIATEIRILLMKNDGQGVFELVEGVSARAQVFSLSASDFDLDGDLDIFCCGYNPLGAKARSGAMGEPMPYHDAQNGGPNLLLRNDSDWQFEDATEQVGLEQNNNRFSFAAAWEDFDNDGDSDLYVANDYGRNNLYQNNDGKFVDVAAKLGVEDMSAGMSISWADVNRDGWMDFHVSNMFSAAGNRITFQRNFRDSEQSDVKKQFQRHARGNSLFQADGQGGFRDVSVDAGITMGRWAWGSRFCDFNNDGWHDILVANGFISAEDTGDL